MPRSDEPNVMADRLSLWQVLLACGACAVLGSLATAGVTALVISASIGERVEQSLDQHADRYIGRINEAGRIVADEAARLAAESGRITSDLASATSAQMDRLSTEVQSLADSVRQQLGEYSALRSSVSALDTELERLESRLLADGRDRTEQLESLRDGAAQLRSDVRRLMRESNDHAERLDTMNERLVIHKSMLDILYAERNLADDADQGPAIPPS